MNVLLFGATGMVGDRVLHRTMIAVAAVGYQKRILENPDINTLGGG